VHRLVLIEPHAAALADLVDQHRVAIQQAWVEAHFKNMREPDARHGGQAMLAPESAPRRWYSSHPMVDLTKPMNDVACPLTRAAERDRTYHLHPYTQLRQLEKDGPLVIVRGEGVHVFDEQGKRCIEGMAGLWCASLGFSEPRLVAAAQRQMQQLPYYHSFSGLHLQRPPARLRGGAGNAAHL